MEGLHKASAIQSLNQQSKQLKEKPVSKTVKHQLSSLHRLHAFTKQVFIVILHKAASPPHMYSSVVFTRLHQCDPI